MEKSMNQLREIKIIAFVSYTCKFTVYLRADPLTCQQRIKKRDRMEEKSVPIVSSCTYSG